MTGEALRAARKAAGLTQDTMAAALGVHIQTLGGWERAGEKEVKTKNPADQVKIDTIYNSVCQIAAVKAAALCATPADEACLIAAPADFYYTVTKGDTLLLCPVNQEAIEGDLIIAFNANKTFDFIGRVGYVVADKRKSSPAVFIEGGVRKLPAVENYRVVDSVIHKEHTGQADEWKLNADLNPLEFIFP